MKKINLIPTIFELNIDQAIQIHNNLINKAIEASQLAYAPYSKFYVGCAIALNNGTIVQSGNQENAASPVCICAEGVALSTVSSIYPNNTIQKVAICVPQVIEPVSPCGVCRQSFKEYEKKMNLKFEYLLIGREKVFYFKGIDEILPLAFSEI